MMAATTHANSDVMRTKPALISLITFISASCAVVILLQSFSMAVFIISATTTRHIDKLIQSHWSVVIFRIKEMIMTTMAASR